MQGPYAAPVPTIRWNRLMIILYLTNWAVPLPRTENHELCFSVARRPSHFWNQSCGEDGLWQV